MDLERELRALEIAWPATPAFALSPPPRHSRGRLALVAAAVALAASAAAFAVPQARSAILRFFHLGAVRVEVVRTLPPGEQRALGAELGGPVDIGEARASVGRLIVARVTPQPPFYAVDGGVAQLFEHGGEPVLLEELSPLPLEAFVRKLIDSRTTIVRVGVGGDRGLWLSGREHLAVFGEAPPRLAGNVLLWVHGRTTYRLEGRALTRESAVRLADSLRPA